MRLRDRRPSDDNSRSFTDLQQIPMKSMLGVHQENIGIDLLYLVEYAVAIFLCVVVSPDPKRVFTAITDIGVHPVM